MFHYAAHLPHCPLLLPTIGKAKTRLLKKTRQAVSAIAADLAARNIETIVLITAHGPGLEASHIINLAPRYRANLNPWGDFTTEAYYPSNPPLVYRLQEKLHLNHPLRIVTNEQLDTAASAALLELTGQEKKSYAIVPLTYGLFPNQELYNFGKDLREALEESQSRIAVISLGDLARAKKRNNQAGEEWDKNLIKNLETKNITAILEFDIKQVDSLAVIGFRPLLILLGALADINYGPEILSYQQRLGVGMMVVKFIF